MILSVRNLEVGYRRGSPVLQNIDLEINEGETVAMIGANGAGKTTLLRAISGMISPSAGEISFQGTSVLNQKPYTLVRRGMSHVPERRGIFANLSVMENLWMGGYTRSLTASDYDEVFSLFPRLRERQAQIAGTLSGGEQQMLAISRALLSRPKLMLLDEPSLGLAPQVTHSIFQIIQRINQTGTTVLLVEQNAVGALKISKRAYVLEVGRITRTDRSENLLQDDSVRKAYLGD